MNHDAISVQICRSARLDDEKIDSLLTLLESRFEDMPEPEIRSPIQIAHELFMEYAV